MPWNWQQPDWPNFSWNTARFAKREALLLVESEEFSQAFKHLGREEHDLVTVETMSTEAITTSEIEGEPKAGWPLWSGKQMKRALTATRLGN